MKKELYNQVYIDLTTNLKNSNPFYKNSSKQVLKCFVQYIQLIYGSDFPLTKQLVIQEISDFLVFLGGESQLSKNYWERIVSKIGFGRSSIDFLSNDTLNDVFSYLRSCLISGISKKTINLLDSPNKLKFLISVQQSNLIY